MISNTSNKIKKGRDTKWIDPIHSTNGFRLGRHLSPVQQMDPHRNRTMLVMLVDLSQNIKKSFNCRSIMIYPPWSLALGVTSLLTGSRCIIAPCDPSDPSDRSSEGSQSGRTTPSSPRAMGHWRSSGHSMRALAAVMRKVNIKTCENEREEGDFMVIWWF